MLTDDETCAQIYQASESKFKKDFNKNEGEEKNRREFNCYRSKLQDLSLLMIKSNNSSFLEGFLFRVNELFEEFKSLAEGEKTKLICYQSFGQELSLLMIKSNNLSFLEGFLFRVNEIFEEFKSLVQSKETTLICYQGFGEAEDIKDFIRYELALVDYDNLGKMKTSSAQIYYVSFMHYLINTLKKPRIGLLLERVFINKIIEEEGLLNNIFAKPKLVPKSGACEEEDILLDEDYKNIEGNTWSKNRKLGIFQNSISANSQVKIKTSLASMHSTIFFNTIERKKNIPAVKFLTSEKIPSMNLVTGWINSDGESRTASSVFNREAGMKNSFKLYYDEYQKEDRPNENITLNELDEIMVISK